MSYKKTKKLSFRGWRGRENLPEIFKPGVGHPESLREAVRLMRSFGLIVGECPWCFFQVVRGEGTTCPVCDVFVYADGRREFPVPVVNGIPVRPGQASRAVAEKMVAGIGEKIWNLEMSDVLADAWARSKGAGKKVVN